MESTETIPIFPLAGAVLLPKLRVPLYIFEPRYRQMTQAALDGDRRIGMTVVLPVQQEQMLGDPDVFDIGSEGVIEEVRRRPDGTFDLILLGERRFRIQRELPRPPETLFRQAEVEYLSDKDHDEHDPGELVQLREEVQQRYRQVLEQTAPQHLAQFDSEEFHSLPHDVYANTLSLSIDCETIVKQSLIEANSISSRLRGLISILGFRSADRANSGSIEPDAIQ